VIGPLFPPAKATGRSVPSRTGCGALCVSLRAGRASGPSRQLESDLLKSLLEPLMFSCTL